MLERYAVSAAITNVTFTGWITEINAELARAGILLAPAPAEPLGLAVLEAMAAAYGRGVRRRRHLETVGTVAGAPSFPR